MSVCLSVASLHVGRQTSSVAWQVFHFKLARALDLCQNYRHQSIRPSVRSSGYFMPVAPADGRQRHCMDMQHAALNAQSDVAFRLWECNVSRHRCSCRYIVLHVFSHSVAYSVTLRSGQLQ